MSGDSAKKIFDDSSDQWSRDEPTLLSDWTARPHLLQWCLPLEGKSVLDIGCGEGYFTRQLARAGAERVTGFDISPGMIVKAREREKETSLGIDYSVGCATDLSANPGDGYNLITAVFVYNYMTIDQMKNSMSQVHAALAEGGKFVFSLPHPVNPFLPSDDSRFHFQRSGGWFTGRDQEFEGEMAMQDGNKVVVRCFHKIFEDVMHGLQEAGFSKFPDFKELSVTEEHVKTDPDFFTPLLDLPLHIAFRVER